jgi:hypothetical protein
MPRGRPKKEPVPCSITGCDKAAVAHRPDHLCQRHYGQHRRGVPYSLPRPRLDLVHVRTPPDVADRARGHAVLLREILTLASADWSGAREVLRKWRRSDEQKHDYGQGWTRRF